jgi:hypothetical protein
MHGASNAPIYFAVVADLGGRGVVDVDDVRYMAAHMVVATDSKPIIPVVKGPSGK